jgi:methionine-rich copper-binding protein CopC
MKRVPITAYRFTVALALIALTLWANSALAHAALLKSAPARRSSVMQSPTEVRLWFSEDLEPSYASVWVVDADGQRLMTGPVRVDDKDKSVIAVTLPPVAPGVYTVHYRIMSVDGHIVQSGFIFTVTRNQEAAR